VPPISAHGVNLVSLTERPSSVMQVSEVDEYALQDPIVNTFRTFGRLYSISASGEVAVVPISSFAETLVHRATDFSSDLMFLSWNETASLNTSDRSRSAVGITDGDYARFMLSAIQNASCNTDIFVNFTSTQLEVDRPSLVRNKSFQSIRSFTMHREQPKTITTLKTSIGHIFCPLFGGPDDLLALSIAMQMVERGCTATVVRFVIATDVQDLAEDDHEITVIKQKNKAALESANAQSNKLERSSSAPLEAIIDPEPAERDQQLFESIRATLPDEILKRITFDTTSVEGNTPEEASKVFVARTTKDLARLRKHVGGLVVVGRNWELKGLRRREGGEAERCLGVVGMDVVRSSVKGAMLVVKAT